MSLPLSRWITWLMWCNARLAMWHSVLKINSRVCNQIHYRPVLGCCFFSSSFSQFWNLLTRFSDHNTSAESSRVKQKHYIPLTFRFSGPQSNLVPASYIHTCIYSTPSLHRPPSSLLHSQDNRNKTHVHRVAVLAFQDIRTPQDTECNGHAPKSMAFRYSVLFNAALRWADDMKSNSQSNTAGQLPTCSNCL